MFLFSLQTLNTSLAVQDTINLFVYIIHLTPNRLG